MKFQSLLFSIFLSSSALAGSGKYQLVSVPHDEIDSHLVIGDEANGTPKNIQGLWWMNGNPLADEVVSFAGAKWEEIVTDGQVVGYRTLVPVFDEGIWSWHDSLAGRLLYDFVYKSKLVYEVVFNADFTFSQVTPTFKPIGFLPGFDVPASMFVNFTMKMVDENEFARDSILLGLPSSYRFRRIVDGEGRRLPAWDEYVTALEVPNALVPVCKNNQAETLPTSCAQ